MDKLEFVWLDLNLLEIFVQIFLLGLNKNNKNLIIFSYTKLKPYLTRIMLKSSSWMFILYFGLKFKYFSLKSFQKLSSKIFMHFCQLKVWSHFQHSSPVGSFKNCVNISLNKSPALNRIHSFSSLAMWWKYVKPGGYMAWLVFFQN